MYHYLPNEGSLCLFLFLSPLEDLLIDSRERGRGGEGEGRNIDLGEKRQSVASQKLPYWGPKP